MGEKVGIYVRIEKEIRDKLYALIHSKYPESSYGALSLEVQEAINNWILGHEHTTLHTKPLNPSLPRVHLNCQEIMGLVRETGHQTQVSFTTLRKIIINLRGNDSRTIEKWIKTLLQEGYLKRLNYNVFEIV